jgi:putative sterol carrier protein
MEKIQAADGVIFAAAVHLFAPSALMQSFLEYFTLPEYQRTLAAKHTMMMVVSQNGGEKSALEYMVRVVGHMGAYPVTQLGLQQHHLVGANAQTIGYIDRALEDFFRAASQKRAYPIPQDFAAPAVNASPSPPAATSHALTPEQIYKASLTEEQEREADELGELLMKKIAPKKAAPKKKAPAPIKSKPKPKPEPEPVFEPDFEPDLEPEFEEEFEPEFIPAPVAKVPKLRTTPKPAAKLAPPPPPPPPAPKTAKEITESLPQFFQSGLSAGLSATIQISISGDEPFEGCLKIHSTECTYKAGTTESPDITILADSDAWMDVLRAKHTAQRAFMMGGLKVRGDFVLLTKFDTLFKLTE